MLSIRNIGFVFSGNNVRALDQVSIDFSPGQIQAVIGENGAGKSTLARIIGGHVRPAQGSMELGGTAYSPLSPKEAISAGVALVPQHPELAGDLSVWENLLLGTQCAGIREWTAPRRSIRTLEQRVSEFDIAIPLKQKASELDASTVHWVAVVEALLSDPKVLILDEPSAPYAPSEVQTLYAVLRKQAARGCTVIVITHRLDEVLLYCRAASVLRRGKLVKTLPVDGMIGVEDLLLPMFGEGSRNTSSAEQAAGNRQPVSKPEGPAPGNGLEVRLISARRRNRRSIRKLSFTVPHGMVCGLVGLKDQGLELLEDVFAGITRHQEGEILFDGLRLKELARDSIAYVPGRRFKRGVALGVSIRDNLVSRSRQNIYPFGIFNASRNRLRLEQWEEDSGRSPDDAIETLSGGMIQSVIMDRELEKPRPRLAICAEPYWGLDLMHQRQMRDSLLALAGAGVPVLVLSSELDEALDTCDRIFVMREGRLVSTWDRGEFDRSKIASDMVSAEGSHRPGPAAVSEPANQKGSA